jgi:NAD(P)-dependent dehydrogenase (short-subunit alcohol dehydrogenase family)
MREARRIGAEIAAAEPRLDVLVNNAGAIFAQRRVTAEGLERSFALNHMSYFVLTAALLDRLKAAPAGRIVSTASRAHQGAELDFDNLQGEKGYSPFGAYARSKLANILFTRELARQLAGTGVTANCFHPGFVASRFADEAGGLVASVAGVAKWFAISPEKGADTLVYLASSPDVAETSGEYFVKRKAQPPSAAARDDASARRLWEVSETLSAQA